MPDPSTHRRAKAIEALIALANRYRYKALTAPTTWQARAADRMANAAMDRAKEIAEEERI